MAPWRRLVPPASLLVLCAVAAVAVEPPVREAPSAATIQEAEQVRRESALVDARAALAAVDELIAAGRANEAADRLSSARARLLLQSGPEVEEVCRRIDAARRRCLDVDRSGDTAQRAEARAQAMTSGIAVRSDQMLVIRDVFAERQARIRGLVERGHLELALASCRRLMVDYPHEHEAERLFNQVLAQAHDQRRLSTVERNKELRQEVSERIERSLIPQCYDGMPLYPADWLDRVAVHDQHQVRDVKVPEWEEAIQARLAERLSINYVQRLPSEIFQEFGSRTNLNLLIDPAVFALDKPIPEIKAHNITVGSALSWICRTANVTWTIARGGVCIGGDAEPEPLNGFYDLSEIMFGGIDQPGRLLGLAPTVGGGAGGAGGAGGGGAGGGGAAALFAGPGAAPATALSADAVMDLIKKAISPGTWTKPGCSMVIHTNTLLVAAPARVHHLIRQFIRSRSSLQTMMVHLDMRWVEIDDGFMEEIGVDWTSGSLGTNPIGAATPYKDGLYHSGDNHVTNGSITNTLPPSMATFASSSSTVGTGLKLSGALLKSLQLNAIARAVERNDRGSLLSAPSITTINGVRSSCFFGQQTAFIGSYDVRGGGGGNNGGTGMSYDPRISSLMTGAVLDVKPLVSADGKYVKLDIIPQLADLVMYQEGLSTTQSLGGGGYNNLTNNYDTGLMRTVVMPLELPMVRLRSGATTGMIPHGGTLLIGGFGRHSDQTSSTTVPFLGHIPFLGRLFGMRGRYSDRRQLYLLITANIHNYQELEATK